MTVKARLATLEKKSGGAGCGDSPSVPGVCPRLAARLIAPGDTYTACDQCGRPPLVVVVDDPANPMFVHAVARGVWKVYGGTDLQAEV